MIAPPPLPPATIPSLPGEATPPAAGFTRVSLTTDVPARAYLRSDALGGRGKGPNTIKTLVCERTPCAFVVPCGDHELDVEGSESETANEMGTHDSYASRTATFVVHAHAPQVVVNQTLGSSSSSPARAFATGLVVLGLATVIGAGAVGKGDPQNHDTAVGLLVGGASSLVLGSVILAAVPSVEQPGATREWVPKAGVATGASIGFRF